jgi:hypothetical protein
MNIMKSKEKVKFNERDHVEKPDIKMKARWEGNINMAYYPETISDCVELAKYYRKLARYCRRHGKFLEMKVIERKHSHMNLFHLYMGEARRLKLREIRAESERTMYLMLQGAEM